MAAKTQKAKTITATVPETVNISETPSVTIAGIAYPLTVFHVDAGERDEINGYATKLANGETFNSAEIETVIAYSRSYTATAVATKGVIDGIVGEESKLFVPFAEWAESLCCDKNGVLNLTGGGVTVSTTNGGLLKASMTATLTELVTGKASKKAAKFGIRNAGKASVTEVSGQSEEIQATGSVAVIGQDTEGQMARLLDKLYEAAEISASLEPNFSRVNALLDSISTRNQIDGATVYQTLQAAVYGLYFAANNQLAKRCSTIIKDGARAVSV